jgi:23S rRNA pseudouridine2605 synthase
MAKKISSSLPFFDNEEEKKRKRTRIPVKTDANRKPSNSSIDRKKSDDNAGRIYGGAKAGYTRVASKEREVEKSNYSSGEKRTYNKSKTGFSSKPSFQKSDDNRRFDKTEKRDFDKLKPKFSKDSNSSRPYEKRNMERPKDEGDERNKTIYPRKNSYSKPDDGPRTRKSFGDKSKTLDDNSKPKFFRESESKDFSKSSYRGKSAFSKAPTKKYGSSDKESYSEEEEVKRYKGIERRKEFVKAGSDKKTSYSKESSIDKKSDDGLERLNKVISNAGICSRREADKLIESGVITVNSKIVTELGFKIKPTDIIHYGGQLLSKEKMVYILLNKPKDYITTMDDPQKRRTILDLIHGACKERVYPVGRLDRNTTGLLLLTNDGELTKRLTHPKYEKEKIYHVELDKPFSKKDMVTVQQGIELEDGFVKVDEISYVENAKTKKEVGVVIHSGKNRIVRRIFESLEYRVVKLDRVVFSGLTKKDLPRGRWRFLTNAEVSMLYGMDK